MITVNTTNADSAVGPALDVYITSAESVTRFKELVHRATNLWPDAHPEIKEFADKVTVGHVQQDYHQQMPDLRKFDRRD